MFMAKLERYKSKDTETFYAWKIFELLIVRFKNADSSSSFSLKARPCVRFSIFRCLHYPQHHVLCGCSEDWPHFDPCKSRIRLWWKHNACSSNSQGDFSHRCVLTQSQAETEAGLWANVRRMAPKAGTPFVTAANVSLTAESFWCLEKGWLFCRTEELIIVKGKLPHFSLSDCFTLEMTRVTEKEREKFNGVIEKRKSSLMERSRNLLG